MGWFSRLFGTGGTPAAPRRRPAPRLLAGKSNGYFDRDVVGESHHQDRLLSVCGGYRRDFQEVPVRAWLHLEDDNPHDANAVRVDIAEGPVGYLPANVAKRFRRELAKADISMPVEVAAQVVGGWRTNQHDAGSFGVKLDFLFPLRLA